MWIWEKQHLRLSSWRKLVDKQCATAVGRLERYLFRVKKAIRNGELTVALSDSAELSEIARRLHVHLETVIKAKQPDGK
jgi:hypothetical protein